MNKKPIPTTLVYLLFFSLIGSLAFNVQTQAMASTDFSEQYWWPTGKVTAVLKRFDPPEQPWLAGHRGIDLAGEVGSEIYAANSGTVVFASFLVNRPVISIDHSDGLRSTYEPVQSIVKTGDKVKKGQLIGHLLSGHSNHYTALHFGIRNGKTDYIDPLKMLKARIRLFPINSNYARG